VSLNFERFGLQTRNRETASDFTWTLGSRTGLQLPPNTECDCHAHRCTAARFSDAFDWARTQFSIL